MCGGHLATMLSRGRALEVFEPCSFEVEWEIVQIHHTKFTAYAATSGTGTAVPVG